MDTNFNTRVNFNKNAINFLLIFLGCELARLRAAFTMSENLLPCPLCVAQRLAYGMLGLTACVAFLHNPEQPGAGFYGFFMTDLRAGGRCLSRSPILADSLSGIV